MIVMTKIVKFNLYKQDFKKLSLNTVTIII